MFEFFGMFVILPLLGYGAATALSRVMPPSGKLALGFTVLIPVGIILAIEFC